MASHLKYCSLVVTSLEKLLSKKGRRHRNNDEEPSYKTFIMSTISVRCSLESEM